MRGQDSEASSLGELTAASFKVGVLGFGGPAGQIALMHRIFVEEKKWIDEPRYLQALNYCMLLPGPEAQQLATYVGWLLHGVRGGLIAGALFVLPGALIVFGLSWLYAAHAGAPLVTALFYGVKAAVLAFVVEALYKIGKRALKTKLDLAIAIAAFAALFLFGIPFPIVVIAAALFGVFRSRTISLPADEPELERRGPSAWGAFGAALMWGALWLAPLAAVFVAFGQGHILTQVGILFSELAVVTFGGAYAVLAYLQQQAVDTYGWLTPDQMIDGLGEGLGEDATKGERQPQAARRPPRPRRAPANRGRRRESLNAEAADGAWAAAIGRYNWPRCRPRSGSA